jgi:hypothetical protein
VRGAVIFISSCRMPESLSHPQGKKPHQNQM